MIILTSGALREEGEAGELDRRWKSYIVFFFYFWNTTFKTRSHVAHLYSAHCSLTNKALLLVRHSKLICFHFDWPAMVRTNVSRSLEFQFLVSKDLNQHLNWTWFLTATQVHTWINDTVVTIQNNKLIDRGPNLSYLEPRCMTSSREDVFPKLIYSNQIMMKTQPNRIM